MVVRFSDAVNYVLFNISKTDIKMFQCTIILSVVYISNAVI